MDIQVLIRKLVSYGVQTGLVPEEDVIYTTNRLLELFELDELEERDNVTMREDELEEVLKGMLNYAYEKGILKEVEEAWKVDGVIGSRMTGAGFGGCTVSIVKDEAIDTFIDQVGKAYKEKIGYAADFYVVEIGDGPQTL